MREITMWIINNSYIVSISVALIVASAMFLTKISNKLFYIFVSYLTFILPTKIYSYSFNFALASLAIFIYLSLEDTQEVTLKNKNIVEEKQKMNKTKVISNDLALFSIILLLVPWPFAIPSTVLDGCRTSIIGIIGVVSFTLLIIASAFESFENKKIM
jgi:hypothetical protein